MRSIASLATALALAVSVAACSEAPTGPGSDSRLQPVKPAFAEECPIGLPECPTPTEPPAVESTCPDGFMLIPGPLTAEDKNGNGLICQKTDLETGHIQETDDKIPQDTKKPPVKK